VFFSVEISKSPARGAFVLLSYPCHVEGKARQAKNYIFLVLDVAFDTVLSNLTDSPMVGYFDREQIELFGSRYSVEVYGKTWEGWRLADMPRRTSKCGTCRQH
jgi:hypothetical protein